MKRLFFFMLVLLSCKMVLGQSYFEGEMISKSKFTSKIPGLTGEQLEMMIGNRQEYFVKGGYYKSLTNGSNIVLQVYDANSNKIYNKTPMSDTLYWIDASINKEPVIDFTIEKNKEQILGVMCDVLVVKTQRETTTYYFSSKYKVNTELYAKHHYGNWYYMLEKTRALPLKMIIENEQFIMESTAVEIKPMPLSDDDFSIDTNSPLKQIM